VQAARESPSEEASQALSLRSRKKIRTRQQIADAAASLFAEKGYDAVPVAEVARLADVSEQTVYNFFSSKEQLVLDEDAAFEARLLSMVRDRPAGMSLADAVRRGAHAFLDNLDARPAGQHRKGSLPCLVQVSPTLRRAWLEAVDRYAESIARALVESGRTLAAPEAKVLGVAIVGVFAVIVDGIGRGMNEGSSNRTVIKVLRPQIDAAIDRIAPALD
jgi:AcrR family transcriptional regulator